LLVGFGMWERIALQAGCTNFLLVLPVQPPKDGVEIVEGLITHAGLEVGVVNLFNPLGDHRCEFAAR
jgi:hypothetical protein